MVELKIFFSARRRQTLKTTTVFILEHVNTFRSLQLHIETTFPEEKLDYIKMPVFNLHHVSECDIM